MRTVAIALVCLISCCSTAASQAQGISSLFGFPLPAGFDVALSGSEATSLYFYSEPGDSIGQGQELFLSGGNGSFSLSENFDNGPRVVIFGEGNSFSAFFAAPFLDLLTPGLFQNATRFPFQALTDPGLAFSVNARGSSSLTGQFEILEIEHDASDIPIVLDVIFEQHSENRVPGLFGRVRVDATTVPEPSSFVFCTSCFVLMQLRRRRK